jgi:hypothetical protein
MRECECTLNVLHQILSFLRAFLESLFEGVRRLEGCESSLGSSLLGLPRLGSLGSLGSAGIVSARLGSPRLARLRSARQGLSLLGLAQMLESARVVSARPLYLQRGRGGVAPPHVPSQFGDIPPPRFLL